MKLVRPDRTSGFDDRALSPIAWNNRGNSTNYERRDICLNVYLERASPMPWIMHLQDNYTPAVIALGRSSLYISYALSMRVGSDGGDGGNENVTDRRVKYRAEGA